MHLVLKPTAVVDCVESAALLCYDLAHSKRLQLSWFVDPSLPAKLLLDSERVQQVLLNLFSNVRLEKSHAQTFRVAVLRDAPWQRRAISHPLSCPPLLPVEFVCLFVRPSNSPSKDRCPSN
jgi:hypothetical protein